MKALLYENLIRQVYQSGRTERNGANADIYREMERAEYGLTESSMNTSNEDRQYEFRKSFASVRYYVRNAIKSAINQTKGSALQEVVVELEEIYATLTQDFYNREKLDVMIKRAGLLLKEQGMLA
jgi:hypothetical protein